MYKPQVGDRVVFTGEFVQGTGIITFIDQPNLYNHWVSPIQLELDAPYDDSGQTMQRASLTEIAPLKKTDK